MKVVKPRMRIRIKDRKLASFVGDCSVAMCNVRAQYDATGKLEGVIHCPRCGNSLRWWVASNGHTQGQCADPDCISWSE